MISHQLKRLRVICIVWKNTYHCNWFFLVIWLWNMIYRAITSLFLLGATSYMFCIIDINVPTIGFVLQSVPRRILPNRCHHNSSAERDEHTFGIIWRKGNWYASMMKLNIEHYNKMVKQRWWFMSISVSYTRIGTQFDARHMRRIMT